MARGASTHTWSCALSAGLHGACNCLALTTHRTDADPRFSNYAALLKGAPRRFRTPAHRKVVQYVVFKGERARGFAAG